MLRCLTLTLGELDHDGLLDGLYIREVIPAGAGAPLLVLLAPHAGKEAPDRAAVLALLAQHRPRLRAEIATSIHRKRVPELMFDLVLDPVGEAPPPAEPEP